MPFELFCRTGKRVASWSAPSMQESETHTKDMFTSEDDEKSSPFP